jgi:heme-degrading monooxygenase HmoA
MITRIWHGKTKVSDSDRYLQFLLEKGVQEHLATPGNLEVKVWRSVEKDCTHFWTISVWESFESIESFAGTDITNAKYYPEDSEFLLEFEPKVTHIETFTIK